MFVNFLAFFAMQTHSRYLLVVDGLAVGCLYENRWNGPQVHPTEVGVTLRQVGIGQVEPQSIETVIQKTEEGTIRTMSPNFGVYFTGNVAYPRPVTEDLMDRGAALASAARYARSKDIQNPRPYLLHVWSVDLLGNGERQQIIEAASGPSALRGKADWQMVLLRWKDNGEERVVALQNSFGSPAARCRLRAIADFDGNGTMNIVTSGVWNQGENVTLWSFKGRQPLPLADLSFDRRPIGLSFGSK